MNIKTTYQEKILVSARRLTDVGFMGQVLFVIIVLLTSWSGIKTIQTNYGLQKEISALNQQNQLKNWKTKISHSKTNTTKVRSTSSWPPVRASTWLHPVKRK